MAISNFNPVLWSSALLANLNKKLVFANQTNRSYEGTIKKMGDSVRINSIGRITMKAYSRNAGMGSTAASGGTIAGIDRPEILQGSSLVLIADQAQYFNFAIDDVDRYQQTPDLMQGAMREAGYADALKVDQFVASTIQTGVSTGNTLNARSIGTGAGSDDAYETLVDLGTKLDEADVDPDSRCVAVPPWFYGMLDKDVRFTGYGTPQNRATLANGIVGNAAGFQIMKSNNISGATSGTLAVSGGAYTILAWVPEAVGFADQITEMDAYEPPDGFNDAMKCLHVYGAKVLRPYAISSCQVTAG